MAHPPFRCQRRRSLALLAALLCGGAAATAHGASSLHGGTDSYVCRDAQGHTTYSQWPCGEDARRVRVDDPRTSQQQTLSSQQMRTNARLARQMSRSRERLEENGSTAPARPLTVARTSKTRSTTQRESPEPDRLIKPVRRKDTFVAVIPGGRHRNQSARD